LQLTVRSTKDSTRKLLLDGIKRKAEAVAKSAGAPEPVVKHDPNEYTPSLSNDVPLTRKMLALFRDVLGEDAVLDRPQVMGGEDFSRFALGGNIPLFIYFIGTAPPERVAALAKEGGKPLPSLHSDQFYPVIEPTVKTGVLTMSMAVMHLLGGR
jgi:metal-dependent amidase/aminoacylase/carboxypeptidase family protein